MSSRRPQVDMGPIPKSTPVLEVSGVTKAFGEREVLKGIDLEIREHQAVALIGASGSGKSTLLRCIDLLEEIRRRRRPARRRGDHRPLGRPGGGAAQARRRLPGLQPLPAPHGAGERDPRRAPRPGRSRRRRPRIAGASCSPASGSRGARTTGRTASPAASSSGSRSPAPSPGGPRALLLDEVTSALDPELVGEVLRGGARPQRRGDDDGDRHP